MWRDESATLVASVCLNWQDPEFWGADDDTEVGYQ